MTPTIDLLCSHRSVRAFTPQPIGDAEREAILLRHVPRLAQASCSAARLFVLPILHCVSNWLS